MRFFTKELWTKLNSNDVDIRKMAEAEWEQNSRWYQDEFQKTQKKLPKNFVKAFLDRRGFHDYIISEITLFQESNENCCTIKIRDWDDHLVFKMIGIKSVSIDIKTFLSCISGNLTWGYSEFEILPNNAFKLSIICDGVNELSFEFSSIKIIY